MGKILGSIILPEDARKVLNGNGEFVFFPVRKIFQFQSNASTVDSGPQNLYAFSLGGETLTAAGQTLRAVYAGTSVANANPKYVWFDWFGHAFPAIEPDAPGGAFRIEITAVRAGSSNLRVSALMSFGASLQTVYHEITGLNFGVSQNLFFKAETPDEAGDVTARMAMCEWIANI